MVNTPSNTSDKKTWKTWTDQISSSSQERLDDVLGFFNITVIDDEWKNKGFTEYIKKMLEWVKDNKEELKDAYIINMEHTRGGKLRSEFAWIDDAINILSKDPQAKIILMSVIPKEIAIKMEAISKKLSFVLSHANVELLDIFGDPQQLASFRFKHTIADKEIYLDTANDLAKEKMLRIRHTLQGVADPYHPQDENEKARVARAFEETKGYFPGLDTIDKMLDFVVHVNIDIPEKMKGQRVEGVYCDVDGTLIEYVGIHSGKEWTQPLRQSVVDLLKKYEQEGKEIFIRTWGDVKKKEAYLRTLGITRPVVNKYDYAGATAEIVIDDTDQNAFIVQSKIYPETYIDTKDRK